MPFLFFFCSIFFSFFPLFPRKAAYPKRDEQGKKRLIAFLRSLMMLTAPIFGLLPTRQDRCGVCVCVSESERECERAKEREREREREGERDRSLRDTETSNLQRKQRTRDVHDDRPS